MLEISFLKSWRLGLFFYKVNSTFLFNHGFLYYNLSETLSSASVVHSGAQAEVYDELFINSSLSHAFTCNSGIKIEFGDVTVHIKNLRLQPFFNRRPNANFDSEIVCTNDDPNINVSGSISIWFFVFIISISLVILCCISFVIIRVQRDDSSNSASSRSEKLNRSYR